MQVERCQPRKWDHVPKHQPLYDKHHLLALRKSCHLLSVKRLHTQTSSFHPGSIDTMACLVEPVMAYEESRVTEVWPSGWRLFTVLSTVVTTFMLLRLGSTDFSSPEDLSAMIQYSVRWAVPFIFLIIAISALYRLFPGRLTRWLCEIGVTGALFRRCDGVARRFYFCRVPPTQRITVKSTSSVMSLRAPVDIYSWLR